MTKKEKLKLIKKIIDKKTLISIIKSSILMFLCAATAPIITYFYKMFLDMLQQENMQKAIYIIIGYILLQFLNDFVESIQNLIENSIAYDVNNSICKNINMKLARIKLEELEKPEVYNLVDRIKRSVGESTLGYLKSILGVLSPGLSIIAYSVLAMSIKWYFPILIIITSIPYLAISIRQSKELYDQKVKKNTDERLLAYLYTVLSDRKFAKDIRIFRLLEVINKKIENIRRSLYILKIKLEIKQSLETFLLNLLRNFSLGICLVVTCVEVLVDGSEIGNILLITTSCQAIISYIMSLVSELRALNDYKFSFNDWILLNDSQEEKGSTGIITDGMDIIFNNVTFMYPGAKYYAVKDIYMKIKEGENVAIVGENGSGKSTIIALLLGLYECNSGEITVGNSKLSYVIEDFRKKTVTIFQDYIKYQFSLLDNLLAGNFGQKIPDSTLKEIEKDKFMNSLPKRMDTILGQVDTNGIELSGGQWQKIAIYRALCRENSKVIIMDEPTARVDAKIENEVYENFRTFGNGKTTILISHRLCATKLCDKIFVLQKGKLIEEGTHNELMDLKGQYYRMFMAQMELYTD